MFKIAICDDMQQDGKRMAELTRSYFERRGLEYSVYSFTEGQDVLNELQKGLRYDVYILDILMPGIDGMALAEVIRDKDDACSIVFVTVAPGYAIQGYKVRALDYIIKPVSEEELDTAFGRVVGKCSQIGTVVIKIKDRTIRKELSTVDIVCVESQGHTLLFTMRDGSVEKTVAKLDGYAEKLTKFTGFLRCHKSYLVNLSFVREIDQNRFLLKNNKVINISNSYWEVCKRRYHRFILDKSRGVTI